MADALLCTADSEEENLLSCLIGKHLGVHKTITMYSRREYESIFMISGVDAAIGYYHVVANEIVKHTVPDVEVLLLLEGFKEQFFGVRLNSKCRYCGSHLFDIDLPDRSMIAMIVRDDKAMVPSENTELKEGDLLLIYAFRQDIARLERMFRARIPVGV
jgi:trk system potassium uptake protein TrkA